MLGCEGLVLAMDDDGSAEGGPESGTLQTLALLNRVTAADRRELNRLKGAASTLGLIWRSSTRASQSSRMFS